MYQLVVAPEEIESASDRSGRNGTYTSSSAVPEKSDASDDNTDMTATVKALIKASTSKTNKQRNKQMHSLVYQSTVLFLKPGLFGCSFHLAVCQSQQLGLQVFYLLTFTNLLVYST